MWPRAGYVFSGGVAGATFARVTVPDTVLLLNPSHSFGRPAFALWTGGPWQTPLGEAELHEGLTSGLAMLPQVTPDDRPHVPEHSGEVVVPFLQYHNPNVRIAVICVTHAAGPDLLSELGRLLPEVLANCGVDDCLLVASSDMSHEDGPGALDVVNSNDALAVEQMERLDPQGLFNVCRSEPITMCGVGPATVVMAAAAARGGTKGVLVQRATSADSPHGGGSYVVGYAGMVFR